MLQGTVASTLTTHMTCASASRSFFSSKSCQHLQRLTSWHSPKSQLAESNSCRIQTDLLDNFQLDGYSCHWPVSCRWSGCSACHSNDFEPRYGVCQFTCRNSMVFSFTKSFPRTGRPGELHFMVVIICHGSKKLPSPAWRPKRPKCPAWQYQLFPAMIKRFMVSSWIF